MTCRILALHGYQGSGDQLRLSMAPLFEGLDVEIVALDAPGRSDGVIGWWRAISTPQGKHYEGWPRTRDAITEEFTQRGPFDGVFGFSQGAALTGLLCALDLPFRFAILVGGFVSNDAEHAAIYGTAPCERRSLHVIGRADTIVAPETSHALAARFRDPLIFEHAGGHVIPASARPMVERLMHDDDI